MYLSKASLTSARQRPAAQDGVVLIIALIMLVAMTLGGLALVRSGYTSTTIAGNLAFQQAATNSGDAGIEAAVKWLETNNTGIALYSNSAANGYVASKAPTDDASSNQNWDNLWTTVWAPRGVVTVQVGNTSATVDESGNTVQYAIHRLCGASGDPLTISCAVSPIATPASGGGKGGGVLGLNVTSQVYYRITVRVGGPRSTVSYIQATVAL
jgi:type IV pilus assembly protein PilX